MKTSYQYFNAHANGAMQCMTSLLPTNPKEGSEGCNYIAISQRALLYPYLPHQSATVSSYAYLIWECKCMIAMHELRIPPKFVTTRALPQVDRHINPQINPNLALIWLVWASEI